MHGSKVAKAVGCTCLALAGIWVPTGCQDPVDPEFGPSPFDNCRQDAGIEICIEKSRYLPGDTVPFTISNGLDREVYRSVCNGGIEGRESPQDDWGGRAGFEVACPVVPGETVEEVEAGKLAALRALPKGEVTTDTFFVNPHAFKGEWRLWIDLYDAAADSIRVEPFTSPVFSILVDGL